MDNQNILKARGIELAERAQRLRSRAPDTKTQEKLDNCADELIRPDNTDRFETAQNALELAAGWREEDRSLAHEINSAWLDQHGLDPISLEQALPTLTTWAALYQRSTRPEIQAAGKNLASALGQLAAPQQRSTQKYALNYLLEFLEAMLAHLATRDDGDDNMTQTIRLLRSMRDAALVSRELIVDDAELLEADKVEDNQFDQVTQAREALDEIYSSMTQASRPQ